MPFDFQLYGFVIPTLIALWQIFNTEAGTLATITLLSSAFGGWFAGVLAGRFGRVHTLQITIRWFAAKPVLLLDGLNVLSEGTPGLSVHEAARRSAVRGEDSVTTLSHYLAGIGPAVCRPQRSLSVVQEITALQHALSLAGQYPVVHVQNPRLADGTASKMEVVTNLCASRELIARALGFADHRDCARNFASRSSQGIPPIEVTRRDAPVQEIVIDKQALDLRALPALRQHDLDVGHYITAGHCTTLDPDTGVDNTSIQRCWVKGPNVLSFGPYLKSHNYLNMLKFWARGEPCPIAIWIGHHPAVVIGSQAKLSYPESHWSAAGGVLNEAVRLVPSITHGDRIKVPADAEIVIEGMIPPNRLEADGPFAEYPGYVGVQGAAPVIDVTCLAQRRSALFHDFGGGLEDHLVPDNMAMEGKLYSLVKPVAASLINVHVPFSGRRFHAYLQFRDPPRGEVRDALMAALSYRRVRTVIAVDEDIDIFDDRKILWALATRVQWHRDSIKADGLSAGNLDPLLPIGAATVTKLGVDATLPPAPAAGLPKPIAPVNKVATDKLSAAVGLLNEMDGTAWPRM
jgi:2,5-furandicarboxylate decarboxylase 1